MQREEITRIAGEEMAKHKLEGWRFHITERIRRTAGRCVYRPKIIELSAWLIDMNDPPEVIDTLRHEIAHALAGVGAGHGPDWVHMCHVVGCKPKRCFTREELNVPLGRYNAQCEFCAKRFAKFQMKVGQRYCCPCTAGFSPRPFLHWTHTAMAPEIRVAAAAANFNTSDGERAVLIHELKHTNDSTRKKAIRSRLRKLGHFGGLQ